MCTQVFVQDDGGKFVGFCFKEISQCVNTGLGEGTVFNRCWVTLRGLYLPHGTHIMHRLSSSNPHLLLTKCVEYLKIRPSRVDILLATRHSQKVPNCTVRSWQWISYKCLIKVAPFYDEVQKSCRQYTPCIICQRGGGQWWPNVPRSPYTSLDHTHVLYRYIQYKHFLSSTSHSSTFLLFSSSSSFSCNSISFFKRAFLLFTTLSHSDGVKYVDVTKSSSLIVCCRAQLKRSDSSTVSTSFRSSTCVVIIPTPSKKLSCATRVPAPRDFCSFGAWATCNGMRGCCNVDDLVLYFIGAHVRVGTDRDLTCSCWSEGDRCRFCALVLGLLLLSAIRNCARERVENM